MDYLLAAGMYNGDPGVYVRPVVKKNNNQTGAVGISVLAISGIALALYKVIFAK